MQHGRIGRPRWARNLAVGTVVACAALATMASAAWANDSKASYTVNISPATAPAGQSTTFDVALKNTSSAGIQLGSAAITPPLGFKVTNASLPGGANGHAYVILNIVVLDRLSVAPGATVHVSVTATAPSRCKSPFDLWLSVANAGGLFGQLLRLDAANSSLTTPVTCDTATGLEFVGQPTDSTVNEGISPSVTVQLVDSGGNAVSTSGVSVTLAVLNDPGLGTLGGTLTEPTNASGAATFTGLSIDQPGVGYTLAASSSGLTGDTSDAFNESDATTTTCDPTAISCTSDLSTSTSDLSISAAPGAGTLSESVDVGTPLSCASRENGDYTGFDTNWYGFSETGTVDKTLFYELFGLTSDQISDIQVCFGAPYDFVNNFGDDAAAGTLPDGTPGFVGLLPSCDATFAGIGPCIDGIEPFTDGHSGLRVVVDVPGTLVTGAPADPWMHG
jgi:hypothetical protein